MIVEEIISQRAKATLQYSGNVDELVKHWYTVAEQLRKDFLKEGLIESANEVDRIVNLNTRYGRIK